jgi:hypothetical protein
VVAVALRAIGSETAAGHELPYRERDRIKGGPAGSRILQAQRPAPTCGERPSDKRARAARCYALA